MKQYRFGVNDFIQDTNTGEPDAVLDANDPIYQIAGLETPRRDFSQLPCWQQNDPENNKAKIMREQGIKPGTPAWFALWYGR